MAVQEKRRKVGAILAGGLVLGVGAAVVMAAWNSSEFATGSFTTGGFVLEGKKSAESEFGLHKSEAEAANLDFTVDTSSLTPGDNVTVGFDVRLTANTTFDGTALINTAVTAPIEGLTQRVYTSATPTCDGTAEIEVITSSALEAGVGSVPFELVRGVGSAAGETVNLCFEVSAGTDLAQNGASTAMWTIAAMQK